MYQDIINTLASDEYYLVKNDIDKLVNDSSFIQKIVTIHNPIVFDRFVKMCEYKMDTSILYEERNKFIRKTILSLNKENIYDFFELNTLDKSRQDVIADRYLTEYIVYYYFGDNYYNFMTNFYQMIMYLNRVKKDLVNKLNIDLYQEFVNLRNMSFEDKIGFFRLLLDDINVMEMFYDDMDIVKKDSHKGLTDASLKLTHDSPIYKKDLSKRFGVDLYYLNGEEFYGFVRCLISKRDDLSDQNNYVLSKKGRLGYSFSYIGDKNIGTSDYDSKSVALFYDDIDYKNIMYVHHADLHANKMNEQTTYLSEKENELLTPAGLIANTNNYNEVYIKAGHDGIKPKALICYDTITNNDILFAKKYELAILLINKDKYKRFEKHEEDYIENTYII